MQPLRAAAQLRAGHFRVVEGHTEDRPVFFGTREDLIDLICVPLGLGHHCAPGDAGVAAVSGEAEATRA
eukprot:11192501-Lingulodinium_polyedra.AAC.1